MKELFFVLCVMSCGHITASITKAVIESITTPGERTWEIDEMNRETWDGRPPEGVVK